MYMYIYLYHLSCEPNHVIKPIFHLSVKIKCYPVLHTTNDLKTRRLYEGIYHSQVCLRGCPGEAWTCKQPDVNNVTSPTRGVSADVVGMTLFAEWGGHHSPALWAACTGGEGARWSVKTQPENTTEETWEAARYHPHTVCSQNAVKGAGVVGMSPWSCFTLLLTSCTVNSRSISPPCTSSVWLYLQILRCPTSAIQDLEILFLSKFHFHAFC